MKKTSVNSYYVRALLSSLVRHKVDCSALLADVGIQSSTVTDPQARISSEQLCVLVRKAITILDDEHLGLAQNKFKLKSLFNMSHMMLSAPTLGKSLELGAGLFRLLSDSYTISLTEQHEQFYLTIKLTAPELDPDHLLAEYALLMWHRFACWLIGKNIILSQVGFDYPAPAHEAEYDTIFFCKRKFDQDELSLSFDKTYLRYPIVKNSTELEAYLAAFPMGILTRPYDDDSYSTKVRLKIKAYDGNGFPTFENIAEQLHLSSKTLRHKLKQEGLSYQELKDSIRRDNAIDQLTQTNYTISQIAINVGFSETSTFIRAFKNWTGCTPGAYR